jgi:hypothetical protein
MPDSKLDKWKKQWDEAAELSIEESLAFASIEIPCKKVDETDDAYINRMKRFSEAKKKALENSKGLMKIIEEDVTREQDASKRDNIEEEKSKGVKDKSRGDSGIPTPESRAN